MTTQGLGTAFIAFPFALGKRRERFGPLCWAEADVDPGQLRGACCCSEPLQEGPRIGHGKRGRIGLEKVGGSVLMCVSGWACDSDL